MAPPPALRHLPPPPPPMAYRKTSAMVRLLSKQENSTTPAIMCSMKEPSINSLPDHILIEILVLLPADFLFDNVRLVCRRWGRIIHSREFIGAQTNGGGGGSTPYGLLLSSHSHSPIYVTWRQGRIEISKLSYTCRAQTYSSCNGLTLETLTVVEDYSLCIINPATAQPFRVPPVSRRDLLLNQHHGISYCAASMVYKVVVPFVHVRFGSHLEFHQRVVALGILTVGVDESWRGVSVRHLPEQAKSLFEHPPLTTEGFLHWGRGRYCLTLDVENEIFSFSEIPLPPQTFEHYKYNYLSTGKNLSLLVARGDVSWGFWELKPEKGEWREMPARAIELKIELEARERNFDRITHERYEPITHEKCAAKLIRPVGWVKYLEVLAFSFPMRGHTCVIYHLDTNDIVNTIDFPYFYNGIVHRSTLEWLS